MRIRLALLALFLMTMIACTTSAPAPTASSDAKVYANLGQLMKGVFYINSNVIFAAQGTNPDEIKPAEGDSSVSPNALTSTYGKWEAVENSALAIQEAANLLSLPGRKCANGKDVPITNPDWPGLVQGVRDSVQKAVDAAKAKNQDMILDAADAMTTACSNCHEKYREKPTLAERCM